MRIWLEQFRRRVTERAWLETTAIYLNLTDEHVVAEFHEKTGSGAKRREPTWIADGKEER